MTGATGNMGFAGFKELFARRDRFNIRLLARKSEKNQKLLENYLNDGAVEVIWGDMMSFDDVLKGVTGADTSCISEEWSLLRPIIIRKRRSR